MALAPRSEAVKGSPKWVMGQSQSDLVCSRAGDGRDARSALCGSRIEARLAGASGRLSASLRFDALRHPSLSTNIPAVRMGTRRWLRRSIDVALPGPRAAHAASAPASKWGARAPSRERPGSEDGSPASPLRGLPSTARRTAHAKVGSSATDAARTMPCPCAQRLAAVRFATPSLR